MTYEAMKQALEALEYHQHLTRPLTLTRAAIESLHQAIAEGEKQEPVAWRTFDGEGGYDFRSYEDNEGYGKWWEERNPNYKDWVEPLYTHPPKREWVGLTDEEIDQGLLRSDYALQTAHAWRAGVVFAMTQLKEKNHDQ